MCVSNVYRPPHTVNYSVWNVAVISGDTLVLRGRSGPQEQSSKERCATLTHCSAVTRLHVVFLRILHLADVVAPRMGNQTREDEVIPYNHTSLL